ncbi:hypothetical protein RB195_014473 [Necator americanus]|uniref:Uncharacterized protein n=1 Tax=Necator americanus TaxID=51031 RepID=A0ABR1E2Z9_NECAM
MGLEQQSDVLGKWYYAAERTSDNGDRLVDLCEQTGLILAFTFKRNHRRHQLTCRVSTLLTSEEQRKRKMRTLKLHLNYVLARNIPQSDIRKSRAVWDVAFDFDHRKLRRQLQQDRDNKWTSRAMEFEKALEDKNLRKAYALLKQYSGKIKRGHLKTLLNQQAPSAPEFEDVHRPTYAVNEEPPTESEVLVCIQKKENGKSGGDDGISSEMLKYLPLSGIRETTKIICSIWIDERIPDIRVDTPS